MHISEVMPYLQMMFLAVNALLVLVIYPLRKSIEKLQGSDEKMSLKLQMLELKVAENYVQRGELNISLQQIIAKLDQMEVRFSAKLDSLESGKVDK